METSAPSFGKIASMVLFSLSCIGLLLFLWVSFGGTVPFNPQGYTFEVSFPYAQELATPADVRIAGVSVGKVITTALDPEGNRTIATIQMDKQYAPVPKNTQAILRTKTILGETYVELTPGSPNSPPLPDGSLLPRGQVVQAVQLDDVFDSLDPTTRHAFQVWQQELGKAVTGNDENLNNVLGNLPTFAADATDILQVLDIQQASVVKLLQDGGSVFGAIGQSQAALRNLISTGETTFATTAANNAALEATFQVFPTFLNETKATMIRLKAFALDTDPLIKELDPVAQQLVPTLHSVDVLSPYLKTLFLNLRPLIQASKTGLPAIAKVIKGASPLLDQVAPFLEQLNPIINWLSLHQQLVADFISTPGYALAAETTGAGGTGHYLRTMSPLGADTVSLFGNRTADNRGNVYPGPLWTPSGGPADLEKGALPSWDCDNTGGQTTQDVGGGPPCWIASPPGALLGESTKFPQVKAAKYSSK